MSAPSVYPVGTRYKAPGKHWALGYHTGVDYLAPTGSAALAPTNSTIIFAGRVGGWGSAYGNHVIGETRVGGRTYRWICAHLSRVDVRKGQVVSTGHRVGLTGATGNVTGPHLHFEVRVAPFTYGKDVNPAVLVNASGGNLEVNPDKMDPSAYYMGAVGPHVTWLGARLVAHGFGKFYKSGPGPTFTETDRRAVAAFQKAQGWKGGAADGFPGHETLTRLAA